jgi:hypothetical protein
MKYVIVFLIAFTSVFMSCDGRKNRNESLRNAVSEFNNKLLQLDNITYFPKEYSEVVTDTIIENTIKIHIKNYTLMDENVTISSQDHPHKMKYYRSFGSEIKVFDDSKLIFNSILNAKTFVYNTSGLFWDNATLDHVWVNQELSNKNRVNLDVSFVNPKTKSFKIYQLSIERNGNYKIYLKEEQS